MMFKFPKDEHDGQKPMYAKVDEEYLNKDLKQYLDRYEIRHTSYDKEKRKFKMSFQNGQVEYCGGVHNFIKKEHIPASARKIKQRRYKTAKRGSSAFIGSKVDDDVMVYVKANGKRETRENMYTKALLDFLEKFKYPIQAAQVPVQLPAVGKITTADLITLDPKGKHLVLFEVKTGYPVLQRGKYMFPPLNDVNAHRQNEAHLQVLYTRIGFNFAGLPIKEHYVLRVYQENDDMKVRLLPPPVWIRSYWKRAYGLITGTPMPEQKVVIKNEKKKKRKRKRTSTRKGNTSKKKKKSK